MHSGKLENLTKALIKAQMSATSVKLDRKNYYGREYGTLEAHIDIAKPALNDNGLAILQPPISKIGEDGTPYAGIKNVLLHESGEFMVFEVYLPLRLREEFYDKRDKTYKTRDANHLQEAGKHMTYLRRYSLAGILGLYGDEDFDANTTIQEQKLAGEINGESKPKTQATQAKTPAKAKKGAKRPYSAAQLKARIAEVAKSATPASDAQMGMAAGMLAKAADGVSEEVLGMLKEYLTGEPSFKEADRKYVHAVLLWLSPEKIKDEDGVEYTFTDTVKSEIRRALAEVTK